MNALAMYLRGEGFTVGMTHTGFIAIDPEGVVFQVSPFRTSAQIQHPIHKRFREEYSRKLPQTHWFDERMEILIKWANDPMSKELTRKVSTSRRTNP
jgi:hypothetical protein